MLRREKLCETSYLHQNQFRFQFIFTKEFLRAEVYDNSYSYYYYGYCIWCGVHFMSRHTRLELNTALHNVDLAFLIKFIIIIILCSIYYYIENPPRFIIV